MTISDEQFHALVARVDRLAEQVEGLAAGGQARAEAYATRVRDVTVAEITSAANAATTRTARELDTTRARAVDDASQAIATRSDAAAKALSQQANTIAGRLAEAGAQQRALFAQETRDARQQVLQLTSAIDQDLLVVANVSYLYGLMARHWRIARARVIRIVSKSSTSQALLSSVPAWLFRKSLQTALGVGVGIGVGRARGVVEHVLGGLAELVGAGAIDEHHMDEYMQSLKLVAKGEAKLLFGYVEKAAVGNVNRSVSPGAAARQSAERLIDPYDFFLESELRLRRMTAQLSNTRSGASVNADGAHAGGRFAEVDAPTAGMFGKVFESSEARRAAADAVGDLAKGGWGELRADPVWGFLLRRSTAADFNKNWELAETLVAQAMIRLAWSLYCRSQWENYTWDYTVKLDRDYKLAYAGRAWVMEDPVDWPIGAWARNGPAWPAHFEQHIVPDFIGWENDPDSPHHGGDAGKIGAAKQRLSYRSHFSRAVVHCCQVRPGRWSTPIDLTREGAAEFARAYVNENTRANNERHAAIRAEVFIEEVRLGNATRGATTGSKGKVTAPNSFQNPQPLGTNRPTAVTAIVHTTSRTSKRAHVRLVGPLQGELERGENETVKFERTLSKGGGADTHVNQSREVMLSISTQGEANFHGLTFQPGVYAVTLAGRAAVEQEHAVGYSRDVFYFRVAGR
jgi:hypothetical protein